MTQHEARELFATIATELGLSKDWRLKFDHSKRRFGQCRYGPRVISLSGPIVALNGDKEVGATIRHEIAHALVGPGHGHDYIWKAMAIKCGDDGRRCYSSDTVEVPIGQYTAKCPKCGKEFQKHRMPKRTLWCKCALWNEGKRFDPAVALSFAPPLGTVTTPKMISDNPQVHKVLAMRATGMGYVKIDAHFGIPASKKGWWSWKICKQFAT